MPQCLYYLEVVEFGINTTSVVLEMGISYLSQSPNCDELVDQFASMLV